MKVKSIAVLSLSILLIGCAGVPMESVEKNNQVKEFLPPDEGMAGIYIYRDSFVGKALKKDIHIDGECIGETADKVFFYKQVSAPSLHNIETESEFSPNNIVVNMISGKNYFIRQFIKMGVFVGGADLVEVTEEEGKRVISKSDVRLAKQGRCDRM